MTTSAISMPPASGRCSRCGASRFAQVSDAVGETRCLHCGHYVYVYEGPTTVAASRDPAVLLPEAAPPRSVAARGGRHYDFRDSPDSLSAAIEAVLRAERPLHRSTIYERVKATGRPLHGIDPSATVYAYLSSDERFQRTGRGFWSLREDPARCSRCGAPLRSAGRPSKSGLCRPCFASSLGETYGGVAASLGGHAARQTCRVCGQALKPRKVGGSRTGLCREHYKEKVRVALGRSREPKRDDVT